MRDGWYHVDQLVISAPGREIFLNSFVPDSVGTGVREEISGRFRLLPPALCNVATRSVCRPLLSHSLGVCLRPYFLAGFSTVRKTGFDA